MPMPPALAAYHAKNATVKVGAKPGDAAHTAAKTYADPGLQPDGRKRYALDTPAEVKAALSYIGMPKNRAKYKPADLAKVEAAIRAAAKTQGVQPAPQSLAQVARNFASRTNTPS